MSHPGTSSHGALRMEFPGGWGSTTRNGFTGKGLSSDEAASQALVRKLLNWRKDKTVIHNGKYMHYAPIKDVFAYFRYDDNETVMVIFNRSSEAQPLDMSRFEQRLGDARFGTDVVSGKRFNIENELILEPRSALLLEIEP